MTSDAEAAVDTALQGEGQSIATTTWPRHGDGDDGDDDDDDGDDDDTNDDDDDDQGP